MKNLAIIEVVAETSNLSALELIKAATKVHTAGDAVAVAPPFTDAQIATAIGKLQTAYNGTQTSPPTVLHAAVDIVFNSLAAMYKANGGYLKTVANAAAVAAGDRHRARGDQCQGQEPALCADEPLHGRHFRDRAGRRDRPHHLRPDVALRRAKDR